MKKNNLGAGTSAFIISGYMYCEVVVFFTNFICKFSKGPFDRLKFISMETYVSTHHLS